MISLVRSCSCSIASHSAVMVQVYSNPLPFDDCRVYRLRRPSRREADGTLFPRVTFGSGRGRTMKEFSILYKKCFGNLGSRDDVIAAIPRTHAVKIGRISFVSMIVASSVALCVEPCQSASTNSTWISAWLEACIPPCSTSRCDDAERNTAPDTQG